LAIWGFVFAIDSFRYNEPAIRALIRVVNGWEVRPTWEEMFQIVDASLLLRTELRELLDQRKKDGIYLEELGRPMPKPRPRFVRGN
jgi:hypothetical protein